MGASNFVPLRSKTIEALNLTVEEFEHQPTGAKHFHLATDSSENVFMVAFRTVPEDSTGVAHILEHSVLCGSEKFPVRDPFFLMIRRSINTFMNAFTTSDYTAYPFASQNRKDYYNLMSVYLDAVFFSRLDPLDFAQEGHRLEFDDSLDSALVYRGVVYNEMKGDTSSPMSMLYHAMQETLYPSSTYHYNSGGDPKDIPNLTYKQLLAFYRSHYHPSNAIFMTFGDIPAGEQQASFGSLALDRFTDVSPVTIAVTEERRYSTPIRTETMYPVDDDDLQNKTHIVLGWLLGKNTDLETLLKCHLLSDVLLDTSASPLRQALEKTELAAAASPMCGFEEDHMETNFVCGVEGSEPEHADAIEELIMGVLKQVAEKGIEKGRLEAVLHQLELSQREIGGDGAPYGLQLIFSCMSAAVHRGDPIGLLDLEPALEKLRSDIEDPEFIKSLVRELLLDNPHRVRIVMKPDRQLGAKLIEEERQRLERIRDDLSEADKASVISQAADLKERQSEPEDANVLPKVGVEDLPVHKTFPRTQAETFGGLTITRGEVGTNGIAYHQVITALPPLEEDELCLLPIYSQIVTEIGSAGRGYFETQHLQHGLTGGINAFSTIRTHPHDCDRYTALMALTSRTLNRKAEEMVSIVKDTALAPQFTERDRIKELVRQLRVRRVNGVAGNGHQYAMAAASAPLRLVTGLNNRLTGIPGVMNLQQLDDSLDDEDQCVAFADRLESLHRKLRAARPQFLVVAEPTFLDEFTSQVQSVWQQVAQPSDESMLSITRYSPESTNNAFVVTSQVNYCASAFPTVAEAHDDSAALTVLAAILRNTFLHAEIREKGGAYGGGATHDAVNGIFRFYSYRDPNLLKTFDTFKRSVDWALSMNLSDKMLEEAVLGIIAGIDTPGSPAGEIRQAFHHGLNGRPAEHREQLRSKFFGVGQSDLVRVAETYLTSDPCRALVTSENRVDEIKDEFLVTRVM